MAIVSQDIFIVNENLKEQPIDQRFHAYLHTRLPSYLYFIALL